MRHYRLWLCVQLGALFVLIAMVIFLALAALQSHRALCSFKDDLQRRYDAGLQFVADHPDGIPGISRNDLERSLANQHATLDSLDSLDC